MKSLVTQVLLFCRYLFSRFLMNQGMPNAASLTFTTLLSLVPLMAVSLSVISLFSLSDQLYEQLQRFVFNNFVPAAGVVLQGHLVQFSEKASELIGSGFLFLLIVALMMMANIDRAFNLIWQVRKKRTPLGLFLVYWAILTLGPLLIGLSVAVSSYLISMPFFQEVAGELKFVSNFLRLAPLAASMAAFSLLYLLVPNRRVPLKYAVVGGFLAALLFELAKRGFAFYITQFPTYEAIYGALAVVPIFLVWVYLSWVITLLGAEFTYCIEHFSYEQNRNETLGADEFMLLYRILWQLRLSQSTEDRATLKQLCSSLGRLPEVIVERGLVKLQREQMVVCSEDQRWVLCADLSGFSVWDLLCLVEHWPSSTNQLCNSNNALEQALGGILQRAERESKAVATIDLESFLPQTSAGAVA